MNVKNKEGKEGVWVYVHLTPRSTQGSRADDLSIDLKNEGKVSKGAAKKAGKLSSLQSQIVRGSSADGQMSP